MEQQNLKAKIPEGKVLDSYHYRDLYRMPFQQLKQICHKEKIMDRRMYMADKETLIRLILEKCNREPAAFFEIKTVEALLRLRKIVREAKITFFMVPDFEYRDALFLYHGLPVTYEDGIWFRYEDTFANTVVLLVDHAQKVCGIFHMREHFNADMKQLLHLSGYNTFLLQDGEAPFSLYLLDKKSSLLLQRVHEDAFSNLGLHLKVCRVLLHDFSLHKLDTPALPLIIDFGALHTVVGIKSAHNIFRTEHMTEKSYVEDGIDFMVWDSSKKDQKICAYRMLTAVGLFLEAGKAPQYYFGLTAVHMEQCSIYSRGYYLFLQVRDWSCDLDGVECLFDTAGNSVVITHKEVVLAYFKFLLNLAKQRWKCAVKKVVLLEFSLDRENFMNFFHENFLNITVCRPAFLLKSFAAVQWFLQKQQMQVEKFLILYSGGDHSRADCVHSYAFGRRLQLEKSFISFYCNQQQILFRIIQVLKLNIAIHFSNEFDGFMERVAHFFTEKCCYYHDCDWNNLCELLDEAHDKIESMIPTKFALENKPSGVSYFRIRRNYHFLYDAARRILTRVLENYGEKRILFSSRFIQDRQSCVVLAEKGILSIVKDGALRTIQDFPVVNLPMEMLQFLVRAVWFQQFTRVLKPWLSGETLSSFDRVIVLGYGAHSEMLRDVLKEYVPGRKIVIEETARGDAVHLIKEAFDYLEQADQKTLMFDDSRAVFDFPYNVIACDFQGDEKVLYSACRGPVKNMVVRKFIDSSSIHFYCKDENNCVCSEYYCCFHREDFEFAKNLPEAMMDMAETLADGEIGFFVQRVLPSGIYFSALYRTAGGLMLGKEQCFVLKENLKPGFFTGFK